jgi:nicotinamide-nucleotide amidase
VASDLKKRFGESLVSLKDQATIPTSATPLLNQVGTAPGLIFDMGNKHLILLPGVPLEMQKMLIDQVIPYLQKAVLKGSDVYTETVHFCSLTESQLDPLLREFKQSSQDIQIGIYPRPGVVNVCFTAKKKEVLAPLVSKIKHAYPTHFFESKSGNIEEAIHTWMINQKKTLALAESCTGGSIASHLTLLDGASGYFLGSLVVYSNALKQSLLGVSKKTLQSKGAVSPEVVKEMLEGLFSATPADYGIAISGIAGKAGGTPETPIGTIWIAFGERGKPATVFTYLARGSREMIILSAANRALSALWQYLAYGVK